MDDKPSVAAEEQMATDDTFGFGPDGLEDWTPVGGHETTLGEILKYPVAEEPAESAGELATAEVVTVPGLVDQGWSSVDDATFDLSNILDTMDEAAEAAAAEADVAVVGAETEAGAGHSEPAGGYTVVADGDSSAGPDFDSSLS